MQRLALQAMRTACCQNAHLDAVQADVHSAALWFLHHDMLLLVYLMPLRLVPWHQKPSREALHIDTPAACSEPLSIDLADSNRHVRHIIASGQLRGVASHCGSAASNTHQTKTTCQCACAVPGKSNYGKKWVPPFAVVALLQNSSGSRLRLQCNPKSLLLQCEKQFSFYAADFVAMRSGRRFHLTLHQLANNRILLLVPFFPLL